VHGFHTFHTFHSFHSFHGFHSFLRIHRIHRFYFRFDIQIDRARFPPCFTSKATRHMAKQAGYIKLEGTMGDLTFYKNRDGNYIARRKGGVSKERLLNDPKFERTRENMKEFSRAASAAKFLKNAFREIEIKSNGGKLHNRLYSLANKVLKTDPVNERGERLFELGDLSLLIG